MQIDIEFKPDGSVIIPWWSPEIAAIACALCGHDGWQRFGTIKPDEILGAKKEYGPCFMCQTRNPWCG